MTTLSIPQNGYNSLPTSVSYPQVKVKSKYVSRKKELYGREEEREEGRARPTLYQYYMS